MGWMPVTLILFLISGIACAWFAASRNRTQAGWFILGCLLGPIGTLILLLLPPLPVSTRKPAVGRGLAGAIVVVLVAAFVVAGGAEFWERYQEGERHVELNNWSLYGDALLLFTKSTEHPPEAIVVKSANDQIDEYERQLRWGMCWTMDDLEWAIQGIRNSSGARGVLANAVRIVKLQEPVWPVPLKMSEREQAERVAELTDRIRRYEESLSAIDAARAVPVAMPATN